MSQSLARSSIAVVGDEFAEYLEVDPEAVKLGEGSVLLNLAEARRILALLKRGDPVPPGAKVLSSSQVEKAQRGLYLASQVALSVGDKEQSISYAAVQVALSEDAR